MTHTYAVLPLSRAAHTEIRKKLEEAGYQHAFHEDEIIDMHGIAVQPLLEGEDEPSILFYSSAELVRAIQARKLDEGARLIEAYGKARVNRVLNELRKRIYDRTEPLPELLSTGAREELIWMLDQIATFQPLARDSSPQAASE